MLLPLSDLRDPVSFLKGARISLYGSRDGRIEWIKDILWFMGHGLVLGANELQRANWDGFSIDLSDSDVARWCDRKIAVHYLTPQYAPIMHSAALGCTEDLFFLAILGTQGQHSEMALRPHGALSYLASIPCDAAHIPTARAALVRHLFGKETP